MCHFRGVGSILANDPRGHTTYNYGAKQCSLLVLYLEVSVLRYLAKICSDI